MNRIMLKNGEYIYFDNNEEFKTIIKNEIGLDAADYVQELIDEADSTNSWIESELSDYEDKLDDLKRVCGDVIDDIDVVIDKIENPKRINKTDILRRLKRIKENLLNEI